MNEHLRDRAVTLRLSGVDYVLPGLSCRRHGQFGVRPRLTCPSAYRSATSTAFRLRSSVSRCQMCRQDNGEQPRLPVAHLTRRNSSIGIGSAPASHSASRHGRVPCSRRRVVRILTGIERAVHRHPDRDDAAGHQPARHDLRRRHPRRTSTWPGPSPPGARCTSAAATRRRRSSPSPSTASSSSKPVLVGDVVRFQTERREDRPHVDHHAHRRRGRARGRDDPRHRGRGRVRRRRLSTPDRSPCRCSREPARLTARTVAGRLCRIFGLGRPTAPLRPPSACSPVRAMS